MHLGRAPTRSFALIVTEFTRSASVGAVRLSPPNVGADDSEVTAPRADNTACGQVRFVARSRAFIRLDNERRRHLEKGQRAACQVKFEKTEATIAAEVETVRTAAKERQRKGGESKVSQSVDEPNSRKTDAARAAMAGTNRQTNGSE
jgi:hypothetical protein